jgi:hypothetical protein
MEIKPINNKITWKTYLLSGTITIGILLTVALISEYLSNKKLENLKTTQDQIAIDILASETQFSLLSEVSCNDIGITTLTGELNSLAAKIDYSEKSLTNEEEIKNLKKYYILLEIKDYLLMKKISDRCKRPIVSILYFYTTEENCSECVKQGYVLTALRNKYPDLRVYSFDYNVDVSALRSLIAIYNVSDTKLPAIIVGEKQYTGFKSLEEIEEVIPNIESLLPKEEEIVVE